MKKITIIFLLAAGMLLSLVGCQEKAVNPDGKGARVVFSAVSGSPATRTAYSGEGTGDAGNLTWERIDWVQNDQILIWSDYATVSEGDEHYSTYWIQGIEDKTNESWASIDTQSGKDLRYAEGVGAHTFWGLYPANAVSNTPTAGSLSFNIPAEQNAKAVVNDGNITCTPDMTNAVMLAKLEGAKSGKAANIFFYPAYTAFELTFEVDSNYQGNDVYLHHVTLTSASSNLVGTVAATIETGTRKFTVTNTDTYAFIDNNKEYTVGKSAYEASSTGKTVTLNITNDAGQPQAVQLAKDKKLKMTIVTLPMNVNDLSISMCMGQDGSDVRTGTLKITPEGGTKTNLAFAALQKHNIRGVLLKPHNWEFSTLTFNFENPWEKVEFDPVSSRDYPQSTQFEPSGDIVNLHKKLGETDTYKGYRQCWVFNANGTATVTYKVMLPAGGTWKLVPQGDTDSFVVSVSGATSASDGSFSGNIGSDGTTRITFTIKPASGAYGEGNDPKAIYFKTYVTNAAGTTYSLDSETQLYDMRGYHYFIINTSAPATVDALLNRLNK